MAKKRRNRSRNAKPIRRRRARRNKTAVAVAKPIRRRRKSRRLRARRAVMRSNPGRVSRRSSGRRRRSGSRSKGFGNVGDTLMLAGGAIAGGFLTDFVLKQAAAKGINLPMANQTIGAVGYRVVIPVAAGWLINKYAPKYSNLAKGLFIGGAIAGLQAVMQKVGAGNVAGTGEFVGDIPVGSYLSAPDVQLPIAGMYDPLSPATINGTGSIYDSEPAFNNNPWGGN